MQTKESSNDNEFGRVVTLDYADDSLPIDQSAPSFMKIARIVHVPASDQEIELNVGDRIELVENQLNGMSKGTNQRTLKVSKHLFAEGAKQHIITAV